jgi:hypothetical protein
VFAAKTFILFLILIIALLSACTLATERVTIEGSGDIVTQEEELGRFDEVRASHSFQLRVQQGEEHRVIVRVDDNVLAYLLVEKDGDALQIGLDPDHNYNMKNATLEAEVTMPALAGLILSGSSDATITGFTSNGTFNAELSGSSSLRGDVDTGDATLDLSGSSSAALNGSARDLEIDVSGSSDIDLSAFRVSDTRVEASGSSTVTIHTSGRLDVDASGASHVFYLGEPTLGDIETSGGSSVERR